MRAATPQTVRAITRDRYGAPDVLELRSVPMPEVAYDEVLLRTRAAALNPADSHATRGVPYIARLMGYGLRRPKHPVAGTDVAGRVEAVGENVTGLKPGAQVFGWSTGAFAEYVAVPQRLLAVKPANLTFEQAAAVPTAASAALQALQRGRLQPGQHVLVVGASGGVGTFAVQLAKAFGAEVTGVTSTRNVDLVRSTGADHILDYTHEDFTSNGRRYDLILDLVGNRPLSAVRRGLKPQGTLVVVGGQNARSLTGMGRFAKAALMSPFVSQSLRPLFATQKSEDLAVLKTLLEGGKVLPVIDRHYSLGDAADALRYVESGHARGKVVITP